ncbi:MAG: glucosamine-6-phosphate deaminase [Clostridiales bacterium]|nr:glucosamine-6-phosphate deaminase [Clostridiales bacterium]
MKIRVFETPEELGRNAAEFSADIINKAIEEKGFARIVLSTGASQFDTINSLLEMDIDWGKVEMFHLDEYIGLPETHPASFRKYLKERFTSKINLKKAYFVDGEGDIKAHIKELNSNVTKSPIDLGLIGIGENAHVAFNDPPADFETKEPFIIVKLDDVCKNQQVGEGWFDTIDDVPDEAISMSVHQIMQCKTIVSCVPYEVKAEAVKNVLDSDVSPDVPATILKTHADYYLYLDKDSAKLVDEDTLKEFA